MSEGSDGKRLPREWSRAWNDQGRSSPGFAASTSDVPVFEGVPEVDLRRLVIPVSALALVPRELARDKLLLPLGLEGERLRVAVADPTERQVIEELEFTSGRQILVCVASHGILRDVIEAAYAAEAAGASVYRGPLADARGSAREPLGEARGAVPELSAGGRGLARGLAPEARALAREPSAGGRGLVREPLAALREPLAEERGPSHEDTRLAEDWTFEPDMGAPAPLERTFDELSRPMAVLPGPDIEARAEARGSEPSPPPGERRKVLIVDDSDDIRRLLVRVFREQHYEVTESASGADALEQIRAAAPDVLVLDAMLPDIHGFDLCRRIKGSRRYGHIPVVLVSAVYRGWRFAEDLRGSYGVDEYLEKPFRIGDVLAAVDRALSGRSKLPSEEQEPEGSAAEHLRAGIAAYGRGEFDAAIEHLKKGLGVDPLAFRLHYHLGLLYGKRENVFEAIQALEAAADLRPRDFSTLKNLAVLYQRAGFRLQAAELWQRALGSAPDEQTRASIRSHIVSLL